MLTTLLLHWRTSPGVVCMCVCMRMCVCARSLAQSAQKTMTYQSTVHAWFFTFRSNVHAATLKKTPRKHCTNSAASLAVCAVSLTLLQKTLLTESASLAKKLALANKLTPKREPVPDRHTTEIEEALALVHGFHNQNTTSSPLRAAPTRAATYKLILSAVSSLLNPVYQK